MNKNGRFFKDSRFDKFIPWFPTANTVILGMILVVAACYNIAGEISTLNWSE
ncbi:MAG TPA: hypothetical protein VGB00_00875 [Pyrinomonadaceae bacterium]